MSFLEMVEGKSVAVIGNAQSLFNKNYGNLIDSHVLVIRFNKPANLYIGEEYDNSISHGKKMDIWAFWTVGAFYHRIINREKDIDNIVNAFYDPNIYKIQACMNSYKELTEKHINDTYSQRSSSKLVALNKKIAACSKFQNHNHKKEQRNIMIEKRMNANKIQTSIGVVVLAWLLESNAREVNIFGMDFKISPTFSETKNHKKDIQGGIDTRCNHNFALEEIFVKTRIITDPRFKLKV